MNDEIHNLVKEILEARPECRESDMRLAFLFYKIKEPDFFPSDKNPMNVLKFFSHLENRTLPKLSSITRARRLLQRNYPDLRGDNWKARQNKATKRTINYVKGQTYKDVAIQEHQYHTEKLATVK